MPRRPSLTAVRTFVAVGRHLSFKQAAHELGVTPTAVSHQIRVLEESAGVRLFERGPAGVSLTAAGTAFADEVSPAINRVDQAFDTLRQSAGRHRVVLGAGPVVASRWLAPKLTDFAACHPEIDLHLINSPTAIWQRAPECDLAIAWGHGQWPGLRAHRLLDVQLVPVMTPALADSLAPLDAPADLLRAPLLHHGDSADWRAWFHQAGVDGPVPAGTLVEDTNVVIQAALAGSGVMLGIRDFLESDLRSGRLMCPFDTALAPRSAYFLVAETRPPRAGVAELEGWLRAHAGEASPGG
ncbi:MAG: LysR substrate-binding domain-containing protein [Pseudomonadota bacterium]